MHFRAEYKKAYHHMCLNVSLRGCFLTPDWWIPYVTCLLTLLIAGRAVTTAIEQSMVALENLFHDMRKKVKKYLAENGSCTGLRICVCTDKHSGISHMISLFLNSALREVRNARRVVRPSRISHLSADRYKYNCEKCHNGECS